MVLARTLVLLRPCHDGEADPVTACKRPKLRLCTIGGPDPALGMAKKAVIGAIMHKLAHLIYGVIHTDNPFDVHYLSKRHFIQDGI